MGGRASDRDHRAPRGSRRLPRRLAGPRRSPRLPSASDVLVHASVNEQFGQVLVEAMACGLPVIAVNRGGPSTIVKAEDGLARRAGGWRWVGEAMVAAVNNPEDRRLRGRRARGEAVGRYAWETIGNDLAVVAHGLLDQRARGADAVPGGPGPLIRAVVAVLDCLGVSSRPWLAVAAMRRPGRGGVRETNAGKLAQVGGDGPRSGLRRGPAREKPHLPGSRDEDAGNSTLPAAFLTLCALRAWNRGPKSLFPTLTVL